MQTFSSYSNNLHLFLKNNPQMIFKSNITTIISRTISCVHCNITIVLYVFVVHLSIKLSLLSLVSVFFASLFAYCFQRCSWPSVQSTISSQPKKNKL